MSNLIADLLRDLEAERLELTATLRAQPDEVWSRSTPAEGWTIQDQIAHLAHFDHIARLAIGSPDEFIALRDRLEDLQTYVDGIGNLNADRSPSEMLAWWDAEGGILLRESAVADPSLRVPWFGPSMSLASKLTARIMETWAHGQDVYDSLVINRPTSDRLRHVARIGVLAFSNSYVTNGLPVPTTPVRVSLTAPSGEMWEWGDSGVTDVVEGPALDFCLVVTQRRHVDDTRLAIAGPTATQWMLIAQAFAGPAGAGRAPGQFDRASDVVPALSGQED